MARGRQGQHDGGLLRSGVHVGWQPFLLEKKDLSKLNKFFKAPRVLKLFTPLPDYASLQLLWRQHIVSNGGIITDALDLQTLSWVAKKFGYSAGAVHRAVSRVCLPSQASALRMSGRCRSWAITYCSTQPSHPRPVTRWQRRARRSAGRGACLAAAREDPDSQIRTGRQRAWSPGRRKAPHSTLTPLTVRRRGVAAGADAAARTAAPGDAAVQLPLALRVVTACSAGLASATSRDSKRASGPYRCALRSGRYVSPALALQPQPRLR